MVSGRSLPRRTTRSIASSQRMLHSEVGGVAEMGERLRHPAAGVIAHAGQLVVRSPDFLARQPMQITGPILLGRSYWADRFEISRRRTWPFHIHNPERTITGRKTNRVAGA